MPELNIIKSPFKPFDSYHQKDATTFFGRNQESNQLKELVLKYQIVLVYGAAGTGKTSLLECGLLNALNHTEFQHLFVRRGENINTSLHLSLLNLINVTNEHMSNIECIRHFFTRRLRPILLIFDQLEEIFISGNTQEIDSFSHAIEEILLATQQCTIVFSIREEYVGHLYELESKLPNISNHRIRVENMNFDRIKEVILGFCSVYNINLESQDTTINLLIENLLNQNNTIDLGSLQIFMDTFYREQVLNNGIGYIELNSSIIHELGRTDSIMESYFHEQIAEIEADVTKKYGVAISGLTLDILFTLVNENGYKKRISIEEIEKTLPLHKNYSSDIIKYCLNRLLNGRILHQFTDDYISHDSIYYELVHDFFANVVVQQMSDESKEILAARNLLQSRLKYYENQTSFALLTESELISFDFFNSAMNFTQREKEFIEKSKVNIKLKKRKSVLNNLMIIIAMLSLIIFAIKTSLQYSKLKKEHQELIKESRK